MEELNLYAGDFCISTSKTKLDLKAIHQFLSTESYWCKGISFERVKRAAANSLTFGLYHKGTQIGYSRIISDYTSMAYLADVYVLPEFRGQGLSKWLIQTIRQHPELQGLRRWLLATADAHGLYGQYGWKELAEPERWMEIHDKNVYQNC